MRLPVEDLTKAKWIEGHILIIINTSCRNWNVSLTWAISGCFHLHALDGQTSICRDAGYGRLQKQSKTPRARIDWIGPDRQDRPGGLAGIPKEADFSHCKPNVPHVHQPISYGFCRSPLDFKPLEPMLTPWSLKRHLWKTSVYLLTTFRPKSKRCHGKMFCAPTFVCQHFAAEALPEAWPTGKPWLCVCGCVKILDTNWEADLTATVCSQTHAS